MMSDTTEAMRAALAPCPFCGGTSAYTFEDDRRHPNDGWWSVRCDCGARQEDHSTEASAIAEWNERASAPAAPAVTDSAHAGAVPIDQQIEQFLRERSTPEGKVTCGTVLEALRHFAKPSPERNDCEPVATLHDDGYYTFKRGKEPQGARYAGWRLDVYTAPPPPAGRHYCERCKGSGEDPEGYFDQSRGPDGATQDGPCRDCDGTGNRPGQKEGA